MQIKSQECKTKIGVADLNFHAPPLIYNGAPLSICHTTANKTHFAIPA